MVKFCSCPVLNNGRFEFTITNTIQSTALIIQCFKDILVAEII